MSVPPAGPVAELAYIPWLKLGDPVVIGPVTFFDYPADDPPAVLDDDDRARLDRLKSRYRNWPAEDEIATLVIAAVDLAAPLRPMTAEERAIVRRAGHALAFAGLAHGYHHPFLTCSSDNFLLYHQNFDNSPGMAVETGRKLVGFSDADLMRFVCPPWTPAHLVPVRPDKDFVTTLSDIITRDDDPALRRLWLALESFFYALTDNEMSKGLWQLAHLNIAFEALLNYGTRREFVQRVGRLCEPYCRQTESATLFDEPSDYNLVQLWASDSYKIRNGLVHGKPDADLPAT